MKPKQNSELHFALLFSFVFTIIAIYPLFSGQELHIWAIIIALAFLAIGLLKPSVLKPINILWFKFGLLLHTVVSPLIMALIYFSAVLPTGLLLKLFGKDPMRRKYDHSGNSYWIIRNSSESENNNFKNQF